MKYALLIIGVLVAALLLVTCNDIKFRHESSAKDTDYKAVQDTLHQSRNKLGQQETVTLSLQSDVNTAKLALQYVRDSASVRLRESINNRTQAAISATTNTTSSGTTPTVKTPNPDKKDSCNPIYTTHFNTQWETGFISANKDSIHHEIRVRNEFDFKIEKPKFSLFKKQSGTAITMTNRNPHTETRELKSFVIAPKPAYRGYYFIGGAVIAIVAQSLIWR